MSKKTLKVNVLETTRHAADTLVELEAEKIILSKHRVLNHISLVRNTNKIARTLVEYMFYKGAHIQDVDFSREVEFHSELNHVKEDNFIRVRYYKKGSDDLEEDYYNFTMHDKATNVERRLFCDNSYIQIFDKITDQIIFDQREFTNEYKARILERCCMADYALDI